MTVRISKQRESCLQERTDVLCNATTLNMNPRESTSTITGSTFRPGESSVYSPNAIVSYDSKHFNIQLTGRGVVLVFDALSVKLEPWVLRVILSMVLLLPPAPAARVLDGLAFAALSALSAAALRRIAVLGPPGGVGEEGRAVVEPTEGEPAGEDARGDD